MNKNNSIKEKNEIQLLRRYLQNKFKLSFFGGLSLEKDYQYINDIKVKYPNNPSALIAKGYLEWRFGDKLYGENLFEEAYEIARATKYDLQWFEIGVNTFLGSYCNDDFIEKSDSLLFDFKHLHIAINKLPLILASCDDGYFQKFGRPFIDICLKHSKGVVHIHVVNPSEKTIEFFDKGKGDRLSFSIEWSENKFPSYYALSRFLIAPIILETYKTNILIVDIDQAISRKIDGIIQSLSNSCDDISIPMLKASWMPWNYYLAGNVYLKNNNRTKKFLSYFSSYSNQAVKRLGGYNNAWFIDQNAMFRSVSFLENQGGKVGPVQRNGQIAIGPSGQNKDNFAKLLQIYNSQIDFSGKSKLIDEDEFVHAMKMLLPHKELTFMFLESFYGGAKR